MDGVDVGVLGSRKVGTAECLKEFSVAGSVLRCYFLGCEER